MECVALIPLVSKLVSLRPLPSSAPFKEKGFLLINIPRQMLPIQTRQWSSLRLESQELLRSGPRIPRASRRQIQVLQR